MKALIVGGGLLNHEQLKKQVVEESFDYGIAVDGGLEFYYQNQQIPTHIVGDFDSISPEILRFFQQDERITILKFMPEKDETDMEIAIKLAVTLKCEHICVFGGTGTRIDHLLGNIQLLSIPLKEQISCWLLDGNNRIRLLDRSQVIERDTQYGTYVSFLPLTTKVEGLSLKGFKYPLENYCLESNNALAVSNEIIEEKAEISLCKGILIMIESKD